jgi:hypothetical protein
MSLSPLHTTHTAANIEVVSIDGIDVPLLYAEANAECAAAKAAAGLADLTSGPPYWKDPMLVALQTACSPTTSETWNPAK